MKTILVVEDDPAVQRGIRENPEQLKRVLAETQGTSRAAVRDCLRSIRIFTGNEPQSDDITLVVVRTPSGAKSR